MRVAHIISVPALAASVAAQASGTIFEPQDFNVTAALEDIGVDVSILPEAPALSKKSSFTPCSFACTSLTILFGHDQVLSDGEPAYESFTGAYWSAQQGLLNPSCVFKPAKTVDVSTLILIARLYQCPFAVKGGGHAAWAGASSIEDGITISMENFNQVKVSSNKQTVDIGPGLRWVDVYTAVEKDGLSVVGGRMAPVGVPGLILGGGISHFSNKLGWACDNVASFDLVTASGLAINASPTSYADLYWALRGGGNNFGIVTNFKLAAFPLGQMWGGQRVYLENSFPNVLDAIYQFTVTGSSKDVDAAQIVTFASAPGIGKVAFANLHYAKPVANASVFDSWNNITAIDDTTGLRTMSGMATLLNEGSPAPGAYQTWWGVSLKMDRQLLQFIIDTFYEQETTIADVEKILLIMAVQPITEGALTAMQKHGGNALGLDPKNGPYFILNFNAAWNKKEDEPRFHEVIFNIIKLVEAEAKRRNLGNDFVYLNYASEYQDPIGSYGAANKQRLISISKRYDPTQVFQYLQPGGFKLIKGAPNPDTP
ncbi:FAD binding domain-containing protein [Dothidotthia symphoricarpi CBS 119687]|uniref:FAD binding domain-containing protein n=1 Tax=Dothidotthia symphoricarpi CBS 119687 TaxID=1392245 RepID=A0A6A6ALT2_9PLEO|nr:FAD binding domain-containing protein [Dothidotthia symphoricarpi CBS 119687]KAF2131847.1 FAD binding domain-containing protein [Dothidotthia symphoricarpi CBS 119687]